MRKLDDITAEVSQWLDDNWSPDSSLAEWRERLVEGGWAAPHWPEEFFGRGFDEAETAAVNAAFRSKNAVGAAQIGPRVLAAETILSHGNAEQKRRYLRPILTGEHAWCQLFSEPGSGSDLAGLTTKAEFIGGQWLINGQKVWTTSAHHADYGILVARSNWDVPKHQGLSFFLLKMRQPGVEVRPLKQMNGHASFNEVFMTDAVVPAEDMLDAEGNGWAVATTTLTVERRGFGRDRTANLFEGLKGRAYEEFRVEVRIANEPYTWYPQRAGRVDLAFPRARATGAIKDPHVRQELARLISLKTGADLTAASAAVKRRTGSNKIIPEGSIGKLTASVIARQAAHVHTMIAGTNAMLTGPNSDEGGVIAEVLVSTPATSIAGGTDEIQRNIIAERVLDMPREPRIDTGPFRDIARNVSDKDKVDRQ